MILPRYEEAFAALTQPEIACLIRSLTLPPTNGAGMCLTGADVLRYCRERHVSHAEVIMSLAPDRTPEAVSCVERLIMRPIDRRSPREVNISRLPRPPGSAQVAASVGSRQAIDDRVIRVLAQTNPKRPGSASYPRFELYRDGDTVAQYMARGGRRADITWDVDKGFIKLDDDPAPAQQEAE